MNAGECSFQRVFRPESGSSVYPVVTNIAPEKARARELSRAGPPPSPREKAYELQVPAGTHPCTCAGTASTNYKSQQAVGHGWDLEDLAPPPSGSGVRLVGCDPCREGLLAVD